MPRDIRQSLSKDNQHCPSQTLKGARCKNTHRANLSNIIHSLDSLMSIKPTNFVQCINDLVTATLCSVHQKVARKELQAWGADLSHVCSIRQAPTPPVSPSNYRIVALADWIRTIGHTDNPSQGAAISVSQPAKMSTPTNVPRVFTTIQNFSRYPIQDSRRSVAESLERLLLRPLTKADISSQGHMYVYWQPGNFGHLKIGRSSDVDRRMTEWVAQCKKPLQVYFPSRGDLDGHPDDMLPVNHIQRVEALVHMELKYCRRIENQCPGCAKAHKEWFEIPHRLAVDVVRKWMAWMRTSPYEKRLSGTEAQWVLKDEAKLRLKGVAQPLKSISIAGPTAKSGRPPSGHLAVSGAGDAKSGRRLTI
ncbi:meiotically up-regulated gene 113-domain-containing protein [Aspergillus bertholletiae]|uniref:Meiotically up-regulated gene 113-domain-containing protein n=1 Tax=Aspergillus bertholletiae TaxID=1226010 RepID=A0A5N7BGL8_9EURO|nr:meiotically up-regulated gene 113-domain-containing protein [Aspergillus bertholletiae]